MPLAGRMDTYLMEWTPYWGRLFHNDHQTETLFAQVEQNSHLVY